MGLLFAPSAARTCNRQVPSAVLFAGAAMTAELVVPLAPSHGTKVAWLLKMVAPVSSNTRP